MPIDYNEIERALEDSAPDFTRSLRSAVRSETSSRSGKLGRSFSSKIARDTFGFPIGLKFGLPRYGYIQHHGVEAGEISDPTNNRVYHTTGIRPKGFITAALDENMDQLADRVTKATGDTALKLMRY